MRELIGQALIREGLISRQDLVRALAEQLNRPMPLGELLVELDIVEEEVMARFLARFFSIPRITIEEINKRLQVRVARLIPEEMARKNFFMAVRRDGNFILLAMAYPEDVALCGAVELKTGSRVRKAFATKREIAEIIESFYGRGRQLFGEGLVQEKIITRRQLNLALAKQREGNTAGILLGKTLVRLGFLTEESLLSFLATHFNMPYIEYRSLLSVVDPEVAKLVPESMARNSLLVPISREADTLKVAMGRPHDIVGLEAIKNKTGLKVKGIIASEIEIRYVIDRLY